MGILEINAYVPIECKLLQVLRMLTFEGYSLTQY